MPAFRLPIVREGRHTCADAFKSLGYGAMLLKTAVAAVCLAVAYIVGLALILANLFAGFGLAGMQIVVLLLVLMLWPAAYVARELAGRSGTPRATAESARFGLVAPFAIGIIIGVAVLTLIEAAASGHPGIAGGLALAVGVAVAILLIIAARRGGPLG